MIREQVGKETLVHMFMAPWEIDAMMNTAVEADPKDWQKGRQEARYSKLSLKEDALRGIFNDEDEWLYDLVEKAKAELRAYTGLDDLGDKWDAWLIFYPEGDSLPQHIDPAPEGYRHVRINAVVQVPEDGGKLIIFPSTDTSKSIARHYDMKTLGDAIVFSTSEQAHGVTWITKGRRLVFSVGALVPQAG
jgi:hypothetical protein